MCPNGSPLLSPRDSRHKKHAKNTSAWVSRPCFAFVQIYLVGYGEALGLCLPACLRCLASALSTACGVPQLADITGVCNAGWSCYLGELQASSLWLQDQLLTLTKLCSLYFTLQAESCYGRSHQVL